MKKTILHIVIVFFSISALSASSVVGALITYTPESAVIKQGFPELPATIEYGDPDLITDNIGPLLAYIRYPQSGDTTDYVIARWAHEVYEEARSEIEEARETDPTAEGEINIHFNSYFVEDRYVGILQHGIFTGTHLAAPKEIIRAFNIDSERGVFLDNSDIIDYGQAETVLSLLRHELEIKYRNIENDFFEEAGESLLDNIVIGHEGIIVMVEGGMFATLCYEDLGTALRLGEEPDPEPAAATPSHPAWFPAHMLKYDVDPSKPMVALTFDDGPSRHTDQILDILERYDARATFYVIGNLIESRRDTVKRAFDLGNEVTGHSWDHRDLTKLSENDIKTQIINANTAVKDVTGYVPMMFRTPYGAINDRVKTAAAETGVSLINWSVDPRDWQTRNADSVYHHIMSHAKDRAIILSHDLYGSTADAMERVIPELIARGYQLVTVSELFYYNEITPEPGGVYSRGN